MFAFFSLFSSGKNIQQTRFVALVSFFLFISIAAVSGDYYVSPTGSDADPGTKGQPWKTIAKAARALKAGDTVFIMGGIYRERIVPQNSGTENNFITFTSYSNDIVTIDGKDITLAPDWGGLVDISAKSYLKISGLRIINAGPYDNSVGILVDRCANIIIENNYTYNTASSGIGVWDSQNIILDNNEVELACNDGEQECISVAVTDNFEIKNNHVHHGGPGSIGGEGIDIKDGAANGKVFNNHVHDIPERLGIYIEAWDKHTHNVDVYNNSVHDCGGDGMTLASEQGGLLENIHIFNNVIFNNKNVGIMVTPNGDVAKPPMKNLKIINNTIYNNGWENVSEPWGGGIGSDSPNLAGLIIRNNVVSQNLNFQIAVEFYGADFFIDHNLIDGFRDELADETRGQKHISGNPAFMDIAGFDFHLQKDSPAIDGGSSLDAPNKDFDGHIRPQGAAVDVGAFEYGATDVEKEQVDPGATGFYLYQNYPNPFNPSTTIEYAVQKTDNVRIDIFNSMGKRVRTLVNEVKPEGTYSVRWDGRDANGVLLATGEYYCRMKAGNRASVKEMLFLK